MQRIQRDRAVAKVYNDFLEAAVKGAVAIVGGNLTPLNPNEASRQQVFVYNQIFFSFAVDLVDDAPFRDLTSLENNPSFTQANHDLLGLRALQILDCEGLHVLATTIVNYRGHRVIAQSIIPGILNNNDLASLAEYGSVDEHKTIYAGEEFHNLMKKVCGEQLSLKTCKVVDGTGKEVEIAGSVEVKGIRGTDKRCYLVDLQGLTPRDMNYSDEEKHHTCLLRPELLLLFQRTRNIEYATSKMSELPKPSEEEKKENPTDKEREELAAKRAEDNLKRLREFERHLKEAPKYQFNTNVFKKGVTFAKSEADAVEKDEVLVKELAAFLKD
jgi:protein TIF31